MKTWLLFAIALSLGVSASERTETLELQMQRLLDRVCLEIGIPGATAAIVLPNGDVVSVATGMRDIEDEKPMTPDTRMLAASIGKSFVATIVLALETDGLLSRSDLVADHLGDQAWFDRLPNHNKITVDHLLHHSAGLPDHVHDEEFAAEVTARSARGDEGLRPEQAIAFVLDTRPLFPAGAGWSYSDTGYLLLGLVIEAATGQDYYDLLAERLLDPLGLDASSPSNRPQLANLAVGYTLQDNPFKLPPRTMDRAGNLLWDPATEWTGGGLVTTSRDLAAWGRALFSGTALDSPYLDRLLDGVPTSPDQPEQRYGAGVSIVKDSTRGPVYGHAGWIPGYVSSLRHYPNHGVTVAFQINTDRGLADRESSVVDNFEAALADMAIAAVKTIKN